MKSTDFIVESIGEDADEMHRDHEVQMARSDCYHSAKYAIELHKMLHNISEQQGLEGWVQEKITLACDYLRTVHEHLEHEAAMDQELAMPAFTFESAEQQLAENLEDPKSNPCWDDYEPVGTKKKNGKTVPNCVPKNESAEPEDEELFGQSEKSEMYTAVRGMRRGGETAGNGFSGTVQATYQQLVDTFGEPQFGPDEPSGDGKVTCYWAITFGDKNRTSASIYDWKTMDGTPMHEYQWHVGGKHGSRATDFVEAALKFNAQGGQQGVAEGFESTACPKCHTTQEFHGKHIPPCPKCGYPEAKTRDEYYKSMGVKQGNSENKKQVSEMTAGGTGAGGFATGPAGGGFKKTTGVPKKIKNPVKRTTPQIGKGIY